MFGCRQTTATVSVFLVAACFAPNLILRAEPKAVPASPREIEELVVTSRRRDDSLEEHAGNISILSAETIVEVGHQHIHELMTRVAGVWLVRGSGQEHLTAIRSPVLTGAGSCGGFLFLEDGIPTRPSGFCNVNQMLEMHTENASKVEIIRGPGSALYGSNALHGIINVLTPATDDTPKTAIAIETGSNEFLRLRSVISGGPESPAMASIVYADDGGFRDDSGYRQGKLQLAVDWNPSTADFTIVFNATDLDQETAGFIFGKDAYEDPNLNRSNLNPEAFRDASSQRLYGIWKRSTPSFDIDIRPFLRHSDMRFLQHFLPGQPLEENGHVSAGAITAFAFGSETRQFVAGVDTEWSDIFLRETQYGPTEGSDFLIETRPAGKHYDFDVRSLSVAPYLQANYRASKQLTLNGGLRVEYTHFNYDNEMLDGNTRDDGTSCDFGGCLYSRPESRSDTFTNIAPKISFNYQLRPGFSVFGVIARGFRAPQATELYRLQNGQESADLDSETIDNVELGIRWDNERWAGDATVFAMRKRNSVIRDSDGFNISDGRSRHEGVEIAFDWRLADAFWLTANANFARHSYDFDRIAARGETFVSGNDIDTAPRWFGGAELHFEPQDNATVTLQWVSLGDYYLDAENRFQYPGHDLLNLRASVDLSQQLSATARFNNVFDEAIADRADYAFGEYRYFPGRGQELFIELRYVPLLTQ